MHFSLTATITTILLLQILTLILSYPILSYPILLTYLVPPLMIGANIAWGRPPPPADQIKDLIIKVMAEVNYKRTRDK